jgi:hypothetical protein
LIAAVRRRRWPTPARDDSRNVQPFPESDLTVDRVGDLLLPNYRQFFDRRT